MSKEINQWLSKMPVVAIIRGVTPDEVVEVGMAIYEAGIGIIEVPLNSPDSFNSIAKLNNALGSQCVIGCGTLFRKNDLERVADSGAKIVVMPNTQPTIIKKCLKLGMTPMPGWATPSDAFSAYQAGARYLKLFPAATYGSGHVKALRAVLPSDAKILAVGGVGPAVAQEWLAAGADGFGIGSEIYKPGLSAEQVADRARMIVLAIENVK